jgi:hypothetical protein
MTKYNILAGGAAPYLAEVIHDMTADPTRPGGVNTEANLWLLVSEHPAKLGYNLGHIFPI